VASTTRSLPRPSGPALAVIVAAPVLVGVAHMVVGVFLESVILAVTLSVSGLVFVALGIAMSSIWVSADKRGVIVRSGPLGWPSTTVPLGDIARASAIDVRPLDCGGWG